MMAKIAVFGIMLILILAGTLATAFNFRQVEAGENGTIIIDADGNISGNLPTAPITNVGNMTYTFTGDIGGYSIIVGRSNVVLDGAGYMLGGSGSGVGIDLNNVNNVTIRNMTITGFFYGVCLHSSSGSIISGNNETNNTVGIFLYYSSNNTVSKNNETNNYVGIDLVYSSNNALLGNNATGNADDGIYLYSSSNNAVFGNYAANNIYGVDLWLSSNNNNLFKNDIVNNTYGIWLWGHSNNNTAFGNNAINNDIGAQVSSSSDNTFYRNNFVNNTQHVCCDGSPNTWDDGFPSGGNNWNDYQTKYPNASEIDNSGIWNTPYVIGINNTDHFPFMQPWNWSTSFHDLAITTIVFSKAVVGQGYSTSIRVTVKNQGSCSENFRVTTYANATLIASQNVTLSTAGSVNIRFTWNTTGLAIGTYTISAYATRVPDEMNTANNNFTGGSVTVTIPGDINGDYMVDISDVSLIGLYWQQHAPPAPQNADINSDGIIDISDAVILGLNWQKHA